MILKIVLPALLGWMLSFATQATTVQTYTLIYSGNLDGELEPCGCSEVGNLGGILRRSSMIKTLRKKTPDLFLLSSGGLLNSFSQNDRLTGEYILKGLAQLDYDAIGVQPRDRVFGDAFIAVENVPWVSSVKVNGSVHTVRHVQHHNKTLAFYSWLSLKPYERLEMAAEKKWATRDRFRLATMMKNDRSLVVLSTTMTLEQTKQAISLENVDILIIKSAYEQFGEPVKEGGTLVLQPGSRGMRLGKLELNVTADGVVESWNHEVIPLPVEVTNDPDMAPWYEAYNKAVEKAYDETVKLRTLHETGESSFVGGESCEGCHQAEHKKWARSKHAEAFDTLVDVNKAFDPNCLRCHTVGYDVVGGFIDDDVTYHLKNVQCESCHGAAALHVKTKGVEPVANKNWKKEEMCQQCHVQKHSPEFDFNQYWPRIIHGQDIK